MFVFNSLVRAGFLTFRLHAAFSFYAFGIIGGRLAVGTPWFDFGNFERIFMDRQVNFGCILSLKKCHSKLIAI